VEISDTRKLVFVGLSAVKIFDFANSTYARLAQESELVKLDWLQATMELMRSEVEKLSDGRKSLRIFRLISTQQIILYVLKIIKPIIANSEEFLSVCRYGFYLIQNVLAHFVHSLNSQLSTLHSLKCGFPCSSHQRGLRLEYEFLLPHSP